ncbi:hypothetical protein LA080_000357 [Diaporthe eres]|nr:hypothetical protein LA080_000357 [Diaporthe eres]
MASDYTDMATPAGDQKMTGLSNATTSSRETFASNGAEASIGLSGLPLEIRLMIWQLLFPGRRVLTARTRNNSDPQNARLELEGQPRQPILSQICQESRNFILGRGAFAFKNGNDGGFWWNGEDDVFLVDYQCLLGPLSYALEGLDGLSMIRNIAVDSFQSVALKWYKQEPRSAETGMRAGSERNTVRWLLFWGKVYDECPSYKHPISRFFPHIRSLTVHFAEPFHVSPHSGPPCDLQGDCSFMFEIPAENMDTAIRSFQDFQWKWHDRVLQEAFIHRWWRLHHDRMGLFT